jgi:hypothetical protein
MRVRCHRRHPHVGQHEYGDAPIGEPGIAATIRAARRLAKARAPARMLDEVCCQQVRDNQVTLAVNIRSDLVCGQVIRSGQLNTNVPRRAANPYRAAIRGRAPGLPQADVVALAHAVSRPLESQVFAVPIEIEIADWGSRILSHKH